MKIAQVCPRYYPLIGGVETVVQKISEKLVSEGFDVEVLTQDSSGEYTPLEVINGVTVRRFKTCFLGLDFPIYKDTLLKYLFKNSDKYDLIHVHNYHTFVPLYTVWSKGTNKLVFTPHYHGKGHNSIMSFLHHFYFPIGRNLFKKVDKIICLTIFEKSLVQKHFYVPDEQIKLIPNGVDIDAIENSIPFPCDGKILLYVGRLEKYKNIHLIIKTMPYLPPEYKLIIIGNGSYKEKLLSLVINLCLADRIRILSGLSNDDVFKWYKSSSLVLNFSSQEAFGLTVLEGLAAGIPILVNDEMSLSELAERFDGVHALDVKKLSSRQIAEEIILNCKNGLDTSDLNEYRWDSIVAKIKDVFLDLRNDN